MSKLLNIIPIIMLIGVVFFLMFLNGMGLSENNFKIQSCEDIDDECDKLKCLSEGYTWVHTTMATAYAQRHENCLLERMIETDRVD